jgi:hypothetical protein
MQKKTPICPLKKTKTQANNKHTNNEQREHYLITLCWLKFIFMYSVAYFVNFLTWFCVQISLSSFLLIHLAIPHHRRLQVVRTTVSVLRKRTPVPASLPTTTFETTVFQVSKCCWVLCYFIFNSSGSKVMRNLASSMLQDLVDFSLLFPATKHRLLGDRAIN